MSGDDASQHLHALAVYTKAQQSAVKDLASARDSAIDAAAAAAVKTGA